MPELFPNIFIHDELSYRVFKNLCDEFFDELYIPAFPNENEREPVENIVERLCGRRLPVTQMLLVTDRGRVAAGCIADLFPDASTLHIIYLVVKDEYRRRGLAKMLLDEWFNWVAPDAKDMYLEADDPDKTAAEDTSFDPATRLSIYARMGFRPLHINYVQPPLEEGLDYERNLLLLYRSTDRKGMKERIRIFLRQFYRNLGYEDSPELQKMLDDVENCLIYNSV